MKVTAAVVLLAGLCAAGTTQHGIEVDADSDCFYVPVALRGDSARRPALVVLSCVGAAAIDLDTVRRIGDSLGWILATCHATRNHRDTRLNDADICRTIAKLLHDYPVDSDRVFLFGFSGQGVQALGTMFLHPGLVRGTVTACAHEGTVGLAQFDQLGRNLAYLITRDKDWNLDSNRKLYAVFNLSGVRCKLVTTPGEHGPGPWTELLAGCRWLDQLTRDDD